MGQSQKKRAVRGQPFFRNKPGSLLSYFFLGRFCSFLGSISSFTSGINSVFGSFDGCCAHGISFAFGSVHGIISSFFGGWFGNDRRVFCARLSIVST